MIPWKRLETTEQLDEIVERSHDKPVAIFKHSNRCGVSAFARERLETEWRNDHGEVEFYFLNLIPNREVSNEIARRFGVLHQSPQILLIRDGESVYDASHHRVTAKNLQKALDTGRSEYA
jgi:bacillithiol system protein YtxJ